jgi:hypothetical protein
MGRDLLGANHPSIAARPGGGIIRKFAGAVHSAAPYAQKWIATPEGLQISGVKFLPQARRPPLQRVVQVLNEGKIRI